MNKEIRRKAKIKESRVRDSWIPATWSYNGAGYQRNKKKLIDRKRKYKRPSSDDGLF